MQNNYFMVNHFGNINNNDDNDSYDEYDDSVYHAVIMAHGWRCQIFRYRSVSVHFEEKNHNFGVSALHGCRLPKAVCFALLRGTIAIHGRAREEKPLLG